jgi:hypothetical protein
MQRINSQMLTDALWRLVAGGVFGALLAIGASEVLHRPKNEATVVGVVGGAAGSLIYRRLQFPSAP